MQTPEYDENWEKSNCLPGLRLPNNNSTTPKGATKRPKKDTPGNDDTIQEIKDLIKDMKQNNNRTTNFSIILYMDENNYQRISIDSIKEKLKKDYSTNPEMLINSTTKCPFESLKNVLQSLNSSISRNKSFKTEVKNKIKYVSLNTELALEYLRKMYRKYTNKSTNAFSDITSLTSIESKKTKLGNKSEKKKLLGNKTKRDSSKSNKDRQSNSDEEDKIYSDFKYLYENLRESNKKKKKNMSNGRKKSKKGKKGNEKTTDKNIGLTISLINDNSENNDDEDAKSNEPSAPNVCPFSIEDIDKSINTFNDTEKIVDSYKTKLKQIKLKIEEKERKFKDYERAKSNVISTVKELNTLYEIMSIKLGIIQSTKKNKYYGTTFEKNKKIALNYKLLFEKKTDNVKKNLNNMGLLEIEIAKKGREISQEIKNIHEGFSDNIYIAKNELKKDINNLMKKIGNENKIADGLNSNDMDYTSNNEQIEDIKKKFNEIENEISMEKEEFE
jgi:hypothetical protein